MSSINYKQLSMQEPYELLFDPIKHEYWYRGEKLLTTTEMLAKHHLSVDYGDVAPSILEKAREFGVKQHEELELYFKNELTIDQVNDITKDGVALLEQQEVQPLFQELQVHNGFVAGTIDMVAIVDNEYVLVDFKFTSQLHQTAVMWQLNVYRRLLWENHQINVTQLYVLWYDKQNAEFKLRHVPIMNSQHITELFEYEEQGLLYGKEKHEILHNIGNQLALNQKLNELVQAQRYVKEIENELDIIKEALAREMDKYGINSFDIKNHRITYVAPTKTTAIRYNEMIKDKGIDTTPYEYEKTRKGYIRFNEIGKKSRAEVVQDIKDRKYGERFKKRFRKK